MDMDMKESHLKSPGTPSFVEPSDGGGRGKNNNNNKIIIEKNKFPQKKLRKDEKEFIHQLGDRNKICARRRSPFTFLMVDPQSYYNHPSDLIKLKYFHKKIIFPKDSFPLFFIILRQQVFAPT